MKLTVDDVRSRFVEHSTAQQVQYMLHPVVST